MAQQLVFAEKEPFVLSVEQFICLPAGEQILLDQGISDEIGVGKLRFAGRFPQLAERFCKPDMLDQLAALDQLDQSIDRDLRHAPAGPCALDVRRPLRRPLCSSRSSSAPWTYGLPISLAGQELTKYKNNTAKLEKPVIVQRLTRLNAAILS